MALKQENIFCNSKDVLKDCYLVGFNLGTTCQRLANACVLYRECTQFDTRCGKVLLFYSNYSFSLYFFISFFFTINLAIFLRITLFLQLQIIHTFYIIRHAQLVEDWCKTFHLTTILYLLVVL